MIGLLDKAWDATKLEGKSHYGTKEHSKRKAVIQVDSFYAPAGKNCGRLMFKKDHLYERQIYHPNCSHNS